MSWLSKSLVACAMLDPNNRSVLSANADSYRGFGLSEAGKNDSVLPSKSLASLYEATALSYAVRGSSPPLPCSDSPPSSLICALA